ncbi:MAG: TonB family protein, partial [Bacteroidia bacterium]|nr:TonB family protein [Bacteroidia bacterium]
PNGKIAIRKTSILGITLTETYQEFDEAGQLMLEGNYLNTQKQGVWTSYYPNGKKKSETPYVRGAITGTYRKWHANGKLLIEMQCSKGSTVAEPKIWNESGKQLKKTDKDYTALLESSMPGEVFNDPSRYNGPRLRPGNFPPEFVDVLAPEEPSRPQDELVGPDYLQNSDVVHQFPEEMPEFPGGNDSMMAYLKRSIRYPEFAREQGMQGTVYVNFIVNTDGTISQPKILKGINGAPDLDREAIRVIKAMPNWKPGKINGKPVRVSMNLPVKFRLD